LIVKQAVMCKNPPSLGLSGFFMVRPAGRVARKRNWTGGGGQPGDLQV